MADKAMIDKVRASVVDVRKSAGTVKELFDRKISVWKSVPKSTTVSMTLDRSSCEATSALLGIYDDLIGTMLETLEILYAETEQGKLMATKVIDFVNACQKATLWQLAIIILRIHFEGWRDKTKAAK